MSGLNNIFKERVGPYNKPIKVHVVAALSPQQYMGRDGADKSSLTLAVSDGNAVVKAICYDSSKFAKLKIGNTLVIREVITKMDEEKYIIVLTKTSKVLLSAPIQIDEDKKSEGAELIKPRPAESKSISDALTSPLKKRVSISGKIVQEDEPKQVKVKGSDIKIKTITVEDRSGKAKVTLWSDMSETAVRPGDFVTLTDLVTNVYNSMTTFQTTSLSTVEKCAAPVKMKIVEVEAVGVEEDRAELYLKTGEMLNVSLLMMKEALDVDSEEEVETATAEGTISLRIKMSGMDTMEISVVQKKVE